MASVNRLGVQGAGDYTARFAHNITRPLAVLACCFHSVCWPITWLNWSLRRPGQLYNRIIFSEMRIFLRAKNKHFPNYVFHFLALSLIMVAAVGCGSHVYHVVEPGETLYSISWSYGHDYRAVAKWNRIPPPYIVKKGERLRVIPPVRTASQKSHTGQRNVQSSQNTVHKESKASADKKVVKTASSKNDLTNTRSRKPFVWQWPIKTGQIVQKFDASNPGKKGVDVAGKLGQPIFASAPGEVVYSGSGLSRYGKLIIIKHNDMFLSAYAHNKRLLVKEGEVLKAGQKIAEMGGSNNQSGTNADHYNARLHFEIRRNGKPVDPLRYLPRKMQ